MFQRMQGIQKIYMLLSLPLVTHTPPPRECQNRRKVPIEENTTYFGFRGFDLEVT